MAHDDKQILSRDRISQGAARTIDYSHALSHEGDRYAISDIRSMASANSHSVLITTPASKFVHFSNEKISVEAAPVSFKLYEGTFFDANSLGSLVTAFNLNRNSTKVSSVAIYKEPFTNVLSLGTLIQQELIAAEGSEETFEWTLAAATTYLMVFTNEAGAKTQVSHTELFHVTDEVVLDA